MQGELNFVPKILLCGEPADFLSRVGQRPFKIIGRAYISGEIKSQRFDFVQDNKIFFNDELQDLPALIKFLQSGAVDFFIFTSQKIFANFRNNAYKRGYLSNKVITIDEFKTLPLEFFYDVEADLQIFPSLKKLSIKTLLDVDGYFSRGRIFTKLGNDFTEIDGVAEENLLPIRENIYTHVYKNLADVGFKRYDAALIIERPPAEFESLFAMLENFSDTIITFARVGSGLERYILNTAKNFSKVQGFRNINGKWFFLTRHTPPENFCNYVVTHKATPHDGKLPDDYKIIHAGRAIAKDLGYAGDDTGDNISRLNLYINEITALYWIWKNTDHTTLGLSHYRRFFTESNDEKFSYEKILTRDAALKILERYDMIISEIFPGGLTQREFVENDCGKNLATFGESILKKYMLQAQPDYLPAFEYVLNSTTLYKCNMFVTRRNIFDAYCKWLFSFYIDATEEILQSAQLDKITDNRRRLMGYFSERLMTTWLIKNRLRVKELKIMQVPEL